MHKMFKMLAAALITAFGLSAYAGPAFNYKVQAGDPTNTWIGATSGGIWHDVANWSRGTYPRNREYMRIANPSGVTITMDTKDYPFEADGIIVTPEAGASCLATPSGWTSTGITLRKGDATLPSIINLSDYPFEMDTVTIFNQNGNTSGSVLPNVIYRRSLKKGSYFKGTMYFLSGVGSLSDSWNTSTFQKDVSFAGSPVEIQKLHRVLLDNKNASLTCSTLTVNGELEADSAKVTCDKIAGTGTVRLNGATITTADLNSTATIILSGANTLKYTSDVTIGRLVFADPSATLTLSGTGTVTYSDAFSDSTCLTAEGLYVPADYKAAEVDGVISVTPSYDGYVKNTSAGNTSVTWEDKSFWDDDYPAEAGKRYLIDGNGSSARLNSPTTWSSEFLGDVLTIVNGAGTGSPAFLALKSTKTTIANLRLGNKAGVDFRTNNSGNTTQTLSGAIYVDSTATDGAVIRGTKGNTNIVYSTISGSGILRILPLESNNNGFAVKLAADNSGFTGKLYIDWCTGSSVASAIVIVDNVNQLGGNPASYKGDGLRINASHLVVNETMTLPENRGLRFLREAVIEVAEGKTFTAGKSNFYQDSNTTSSLVKDGAGDLVLADTVTTSDKSKTITVLAGTVTLPIDTDYTLGANTVVQSQTETTVTLAAKASTPEITDPTEEKTVESEEAAEAITLNITRPAAVTDLGDKAPSAETYAGYFTKNVVDNGDGTFTVSAVIKDEVTEDADAEVVAVIAAGGTAKIPAGLYYKLTPGKDLSLSGTAVSGLSEGEVVIEKVGTTQGFVKVQLGAGAID